VIATYAIDHCCDLGEPGSLGDSNSGTLVMLMARRCDAGAISNCIAAMKMPILRDILGIGRY
jgi:hypothetical protein